MYTGLQHTHLLMVVLFLVSILIKTILLFIDQEKFEKYRKKTKVPEMITTFLFLITGIMMLVSKGGGVHFFLWVKLGVILVAIPISIVAFKKKKKYLALVGAFLFIMVYGLAEMAKGKANVEKVEVTQSINGSIEHGKLLYEKNCVVCHGEAGDKGLGGAANLIQSQLEEADTKSIIMNGKGDMPGYKEALNEQEIEALKSYVISLRASN